jgi:hypothetical protein
VKSFVDSFPVKFFTVLLKKGHKIFEKHFKKVKEFMVKLKRNVIFGKIFRVNTKKPKTFASTLKNTHRVHEECVFEWRLV